MQARESLEGAFQVIKLLSRRPSQWEHCVVLARLKFDKYFKKKVNDSGPQSLSSLHISTTVCKVAVHYNKDVVVVVVVSKALQLLYSFPLDTRLKDGSKFPSHLDRLATSPLPLMRHTWTSDMEKVVWDSTELHAGSPGNVPGRVGLSN